jgi:hypothetical protein
MPNLPARTSRAATGPISSRERRAITARRDVEESLQLHTLQVHFREQAAKIEGAAAESVSEDFLDGELKLYFEGLAKAKGSPVAAKLIADRLEELVRIDNAVLRRYFQ